MLLCREPEGFGDNELCEAAPLESRKENKGIQTVLTWEPLGIFDHFPAFSVIICKCEERTPLCRFHALHGDTFLPSAQMLRSEGGTGLNLFHGSSDAAHRAVTKHSLGSSALAQAAAIDVNTSMPFFFGVFPSLTGLKRACKRQQYLHLHLKRGRGWGGCSELKRQVTPAGSSGSAAPVKSSCGFRHVEVTSR